MVHYAVYYSTKDSGRVKNYAGEDKVDYICQVLNEIEEEVIILSNAKTTKKEFAKREYIQLTEKTKLLYFSSLPRINTVIHAIDVLWGYLQLIVYILFHVKKDDTVLVYHSLGYRGIWGALRRIKCFNYILEVEELFHTFQVSISSYKKHERKVFAYPDGFLFSNSILEEEINTRQKPFALINGIYKGNSYIRGTKSEKIKVVYAGSLEKQKGVDYVIKTALYLDTRYEVHIIGFGSEEDIKRINKLIDAQSQSSARVSYDGVFKGEEYLEYLQTCDIGMCIQDENDEFNKFEYPSKIFSYLANGLQVVANDLIQLRNSDVFPYLHITKSKEPEDIALAITSCLNAPLDSKEILNQLDRGFKEEIKTLLRR